MYWTQSEYILRGGEEKSRGETDCRMKLVKFFIKRDFKTDGSEHIIVILKLKIINF